MAAALSAGGLRFEVFMNRDGQGTDASPVLARYMAEVGRDALLTAAEERALTAELAAARMGFARQVATIPGALAGILAEVEARLAGTGRTGDLVDGLLAGALESDAPEDPEHVAQRALARLLALHQMPVADTGTLRREWLLRQFESIRWRPAATDPWVDPFLDRAAEVRAAERSLRQICRFAGGLSVARLDGLAPGGLSRAQFDCWLAQDLLDARMAESLRGHLEPLWSRIDLLLQPLGLAAVATLELAEELEASRAEVRRLTARMVHSNLRLVVHIARGYRQRGVLLEDLIQEGNLGLLRAVDRFDHRRGHRFSTYASWWIRQAVARAVVEQGRTIRVPQALAALVGRIRAVTARMLAREGREPTTEEFLAMDLGPAERVRQALELVQEPLALDAPIGQEGSTPLLELTPGPGGREPDERMQQAQLSRVAQKLLGQLDARSAEVLRLRFGIGTGRERTLTEVGDVLGLSGERVRQLETAALDTLRGQAGDLELLFDLG